MRRPAHQQQQPPTEARFYAAATEEEGEGAAAGAGRTSSRSCRRRRGASCAVMAASVMAAAVLCLGTGPAPALAYQLGAAGSSGGLQQQALGRCGHAHGHGLAQPLQQARRPALTRMRLSPLSSSSSGEEEPEGTRVEEALRVTTRQIRALQRLLDGFTEVPAANDPPAFPPPEVVLPVPTRDATERDKAEIERLNREYYACLNGRDVKGLLALWRQEEEAGPGGVMVQMYANEDKIITGREEIDKHYDSRFRSTWATNKHKARLDECAVEDERVFLRGINAFVTNKEVWENPKTRERKVMFATKVLAKSNGGWAIVHVHTGDGSQIEVNPNGQMKLTDGLRSLGQQRGAGQQGQGQNQLGAGSLGGLLGGGGGAGGVGGETSGFTADGREFRTITTPDGYRIVIGGNGVGGIQGSLGGVGGAAGGAMPGGHSGQETKEALLKALIQDLAKTGGKGDGVVPLQLGASGARGGSRGGELCASSSSLEGGRGRRGGGGGGGDDGGNLTRKTVAAIRQLCQEGKLTVEQKQKLIFSIIRSTKREEVSQVEMAYDLLVENALAGEADAMFEFGEQCTMILETIDDELAMEDDDDEEDGAFEGQLFDDRRLR